MLLSFKFGWLALQVAFVYQCFVLAASERLVRQLYKSLIRKYYSM